jgi:hypothetical protein
MSYSVETSVTYIELTCWVCGCQFAVDNRMYSERKNRGEDLWCPHGCHLSLGEPKSVKLQRDLEKAKRDTAFWIARSDEHQRCAERQVRRVVALRGVVTRTKRRIAAGKCPCCHVRFSDLQGHMSKTHPDYGDEK